MKIKTIEEKLLPKEIAVGELTLAIPTEKDTKQLLDTLKLNKEHLGQFLNIPYKITDINSSQKYIEKINDDYSRHKTTKYIIKLDNEIMGMFGIMSISWKHAQAEFSFWLAKKCVGKGYVSKCIKKVEEILFDIGFERLAIKTSTKNIATQKVAKRNGYTYEGTTRHDYFSVYRQDFCDSMIFSKLRLEWLGREK